MTLMLSENFSVSMRILSKSLQTSKTEIKQNGNKTRSGEIRVNIRTPAKPNVGQDKVSGGVSVLSWLAAPVANVLWQPHRIRLKSNSVIRSRSVKCQNRCNVSSMEGATVYGAKHLTTIYLAARDFLSASWQRNLDFTHSLGTLHTISWNCLHQKCWKTINWSSLHLV